MTDPSVTLIAALFDRSGSMASIRDDMEGGWKTLLQKQKQLPGTVLVSLAQFDDKYDDVYALAPIACVPEYRLEPRGGTALVDAMGRFVTELGERLAELPEHKRPATVIVVVVTDGEENASREWTDEKIRELITHQQDVYAWKFVFLGANLDAVKVGHAYGVGRGGTLTFNADTQGTHAVMASAGEYITTTRTVGAAFFDDQDRTAAVGGTK